MAQSMMTNQRPLEVELFHNQVGYLSDPPPPAEYFELFNSLIVGLNNCRISHALKTNPSICHDYANGVGGIGANVKKKEIVITEAIVHEVLKFGDQPNHPTSYKQDRVLPAQRRMSSEGNYLTCIAENKGGLDQLNKSQASALVALVNDWNYNFSAFIFDNMKKMLEDLKKKFFMLYPRFIKMILDVKYPELVKSTNHLNLKPMGPRCFEKVCKERKEKQHNFVGWIRLENHGRFGLVVPAPRPLNAMVAEEHDMQPKRACEKVEIETEILDTDEEDSDNDSDVEVIATKETEETLRKPTLMTVENLEAVIESLKDSVENPPSAPIPETEVRDEDDATDVAEQASNKK
ncbi:hypothetical protein Hanom_Chr09g00795791 [Helianthus anomalus]